MTVNVAVMARLSAETALHSAAGDILSIEEARAALATRDGFTCRAAILALCNMGRHNLAEKAMVWLAGQILA